MNKEHSYTLQQSIQLYNEPYCCTECEFIQIINQIWFSVLNLFNTSIIRETEELYSLQTGILADLLSEKFFLPEGKRPVILLYADKWYFITAYNICLKRCLSWTVNKQPYASTT